MARARVAVGLRDWVFRSVVMRRLPRRKSAIVLISLVIFAAVIGAGLWFGVGTPSSEKSVERARAFHQQGEFSASIIELKNALRSDPKNIAARISLGRIYLDIRDLTSAAKELNPSGRLCWSFPK